MARISDVKQLKGIFLWKHILGSTQIVLELPNIESDKLHFLQTTLNHYLTYCGCREGAIGTWIGVLSTTGYFFAYPTPLTIRLVATSFFAVVATALLGKISGLIFARFMIHKTIKKFASEQ